MWATVKTASYFSISISHYQVAKLHKHNTAFNTLLPINSTGSGLVHVVPQLILGVLLIKGNDGSNTG